MATFTIPKDGMLVTITNNSTSKTVDFEEIGFISPTLVPSGNGLATEVIPATPAFVPAFKSYFKFTIKPGDTLQFTTRTAEEAAYYNQLSLDDCTVTVETPETTSDDTDEEDGGEG